MKYPIILKEEEGGGYYASSPDIPELHTCGDTKEEALSEALDGLITSFEFYFDENEAIPLPSEIVDESVELPAIIWTKVLLLNAVVEKKIKPSELARLIDVKRQNIRDIFNLRHETKLSTLERAAFALGKKIEIAFY
ncbi:antitoxin [Marinomonas sp. CT5]|uniref:type II toxin-antitoxin system HicB family antitoxin n=1 Tax=Marinomonas sp. CT5 TaxID=2066133 RepID=UPI001BAE99C4|nr:type II toxin-antitoxin system HicB family antitoxin [Marinomonas sp. CT5]QUX96544.1 antitoxin [Marinomonas sp. CT5]